MKKLMLLLCMTAMLTGCGVEGKSSEADSGESTVIEKEETTSADTSEAETSTENSTEAETTAEITTTEAAEEATTAEITTAEAEKIVVVQDPKAMEISRLLSQHYGNREKVAAELGISKTTLWRYMKKYGIEASYGK